jgi:hypothetical protein
MPTPETADAAQLRSRATTLRRLASMLAEHDLCEVRRRAGDDVWRGPAADRCRDDLSTAQRRLGTAVDDLRRHALVLDRQADDADLRAAITMGAPS